VHSTIAVSLRSFSGNTYQAFTSGTVLVQQSHTAGSSSPLTVLARTTSKNCTSPGPGSLRKIEPVMNDRVLSDIVAVVTLADERGVLFTNLPATAGAFHRLVQLYQLLHGTALRTSCCAPTPQR
jgi:hypothetical protein